MKQYTGNSLYRGGSYDFRLCAKSMKQVAEIMNTTVHQVKTYWGAGRKIEDDEIFEGVLVKAYGSKAVEALGLTKGNLHDEITLEEFKERVDKFRDEQYEEIKKNYNIKG